MSQKCYGIFGSMADICLEGLRKPRKILKVDISTKAPRMFLKCILERERERDRSGMAAWLGAIKEGAQEGEEEKNFFDRNRSWKELLLPSWPKKLVFEIILYST